MSTRVEATPTKVVRADDALLRRYGIACTDSTRATLAAYVARTHRARWWGVVGAVVTAGVGLFGSTGDSLGIGIARLLAGYLAGSSAAELLAPRRRAEGDVRRASLVTREPRLLLPTWARVLPWALLLPCLGAPLLLLGSHPTGVTRYHDRLGSGYAWAHWFAGPPLLTVAGTALVAIAIWWFTVHRLATRRLPADDTDAARLDLLMRALLARAVSGAAAALGMCLLAGLALLSVDPLVSQTCTAPERCGYVYVWHTRHELVNDIGLVLLAGAVIMFWFCRLARVDPAVLGTAAGSQR